MCNQSSTLIHSQLISQTGGLAQLARAPALHAGGQRFESVILHHLSFSFFPEILDQTFKKYKQILTCCSIETKFFANFRVAIVIIAIIEN